MFRKMPVYFLILLTVLTPGLGVCAEDKKSSLKDETITVTAQKQEQNLQDVSISMTVLDSLDLEDMQVHSIKDIAAHTPNFMVFSNGNSGQTPPTVRGLTTDVHALSTTIGLYVDGIPVLSGIGFDSVLMDVERVEILRGPQGTLYGKNAEAGVINVVSKTPGNERRSSVWVELGEDHKQEFKFSTSGPIIKDCLSVGVSGLSYEKDGFVKNTYTDERANDRQHTYGKIYLKATPTEDLSASLIVSRLKYNDGDSDMNWAKLGSKREVSSDFQGYNHSSSTMGALKINYDFGDILFESVTTAREYLDDSGGDFDFSPADKKRMDKDITYKNMSQEFRLSSQGGNFSWLAGVYGDRDDNNLEYTKPVLGDKELEGQSLGIFAHTDWTLNDSFSFSAGIRYDWEEKSYKNNLDGTDIDEDFSALSPKLALRYRLNPTSMVYASASKGFQSGGFSDRAPSVDLIPYSEETLWAYEIGSKNTFLNNRVSFNTAFYYMDIEDMQVNNSIALLKSYRANAAEATSKGVELELNVKFTDQLKAFISYGYNKTEFDSFSDNDGDHEGKSNPFAPEYNYNVGMEYRGQSGLYGRCDINGYGKMYFDTANGIERDPYDLVNLKLGYESESFDIYLYGKNIFDKEYDSDGYYSGFFTIYSPPREIGVSAAFRF